MRNIFNIIFLACICSLNIVGFIVDLLGLHVMAH